MVRGRLFHWKLNCYVYLNIPNDATLIVLRVASWLVGNCDIKAKSAQLDLEYGLSFLITLYNLTTESWPEP